MNQQLVIGALVGLVVGAAAGYYFGYDIGWERAVKALTKDDTLKAETTVRTLENVKTNPYENVKTNPFE